MMPTEGAAVKLGFRLGAFGVHRTPKLVGSWPETYKGNHFLHVCGVQVDFKAGLATIYG